MQPSTTKPRKLRRRGDKAPKTSKRLTVVPAKPNQGQKILAPELPGLLTKGSSARSQFTEITHDTLSTAQSSDTPISPITKIQRLSLREEEEEEEVLEHQPTTSYFIPGITGKARCLDDKDGTETTPALRKRNSICTSGARRYSRESSFRSQKSASSFSASSQDRKPKPLQRKSVSLQPGEASYHSRGSISSHSDGVLDNAYLLYGEVVSSIHARRENNIPEGDKSTSGLNDHDFQRMLYELQKDMSSLETSQHSSGSGRRNESGEKLRDQVDSIRGLLSNYERKGTGKKSRKEKPAPR